MDGSQESFTSKFMQDGYSGICLKSNISRCAARRREAGFGGGSTKIITGVVHYGNAQQTTEYVRVRSESQVLFSLASELRRYPDRDA